MEEMNARVMENEVMDETVEAMRPLTAETLARWSQESSEASWLTP